MYLKEFMQKENTTRDTVRHYIYLNLITPARKGRNYWFTENECDIFEAVKEFQDLGFSLQEIKDIKKLHDESCSTEKQRKQNLKLIKDKIAVISAKINKLKMQKKVLAEVKKTLQKKSIIETRKK
ncbi:MerR family transcriptional regulator [Lactobacillus sp. M0398]|uniref:MerR family transcriptional regulator n=1 Tax=unclassified Lactobacillus TaxID=2620435 RepID=UPI0018DC7438|nr:MULTISPECIES: MerR family transcriptional regulator [unclassified Lactobacillus]MBI0121623.1 MerR family transcriptional regulator [Lactobacillus sp. M0398]MBI0122302.1 MerR family transcriptional regulator [Lactobacillus sp. W8174]MBI0134634.1 MerR family transcriptional regulator [Lactobacillus sp. W8173]